MRPEPQVESRRLSAQERSEPEQGSAGRGPGWERAWAREPAQERGRASPEGQWVQASKPAALVRVARQPEPVRLLAATGKVQE